MDVGSLFVKLGLDTQQFISQLKTTEATLKDFGKRTTDIGKDLSTKVTLPLTALGVGAVMTAGKFEQLQTSLEVLTGSAEDGARAFQRLQEFSAGTPFQLTELVQANNTLMGFGLNADEAYNSLQQLGDIAAISGSNLGSVSVAFGQAAAAGRVMTQDLNQFINNGIPVYELLGEVTGKSVGELRDLASQGGITFAMLQQAFSTATSEGGKFFGGMEKQSKTINGLFSTLKDNVSLALGELGKTIVTSINLEANINKLITGIQGLVERFKNMSPEARKFLVIAGGLAAAIGPVLVAMGTFATMASKVVMGLRLITAAASANPFGLIAAGIGILATVLLPAIIRNFDGVKSAITPLIKVVGDLFKEFQPVVKDLFSALLPILRDVADIIVRSVIVALQGLTTVFTAVAGVLLKIVRGIKSLIGYNEEATESTNEYANMTREEALVAVNQHIAALEKQGGVIAQIGLPRLYALKKQLESVSESQEIVVASTDAATRSLERMLNTFQKLRREQEYARVAQEGLVEVNELMGGSQNKLGGVLDRYTAHMDSVNKANTAYRNSLPPIISLGETMADRFEVAVENIAQSARTFLVDSVGNSLAMMAANIAAGEAPLANIGKMLLSTLADLAMQVGKIAIGVGIGIEGIKKALLTLNPIVAIAAGAALVALGGIAKAALANAAGGGNVPAFAEGGIVSGPTLGLIGEYAGARSNPEVIAPLNKLQGMLGGMGGEVTFRIQGTELVGVLNRQGKIANRS